MIIAATKATKKFSNTPPARLNESLSQIVKISIKVLITRVNNPRVIKFIGKVNNLTKGRTKALTSPKITATMIRLRMLPLKLKLESNMLVSQMAKALIKIRKISFIFHSLLLVIFMKVDYQ